VAVSSVQRSVRVVVRDPGLGQSRLTVFFRALLALPHLVWLVLWSVPATIAAWAGWLATLVLGRLPEPLHRFLAAYLRYDVHVFAYLFLAARRFPGFLGRPGYEVDLEIDPPAEQRRLGVLFRQLLASPAALLAIVIGSGLVWFALLAWWSALARGRRPAGIRDFTAYGLGYSAQHGAYTMLLTSRYPHAGPQLTLPSFELPPHPVRLRMTDDLRRSRLTVFFRLLLALPHLVWLWLWSIAALVAVVVAWLVALALGSVPQTLHRFLAAYTRYAAHVTAFVMVVGGPFPAFGGGARAYPVDLEIDQAAPQRRLVTLFRLFLAVPALILGYPLALALVLVAVGGWLYALVLGRVPEGLRDLGAAIVRYQAQTNAYLLLVTDRYPYSSPALATRASSEEPAPSLAVATS